MATKLKELIKQNNEKRKLLTADNESYYENVLVYIRTNFLRDEMATEELLLELLVQLIEAQKEGKAAEEVFGQSPKELAKQLVESIPKQSTKSVLEFSAEIIFTLFGWYLIVWGIVPLIQQRNQIIYVGTVSLSAIFLLSALMFIVYVVIVYLRNYAFHKMNKATRWLYSSLILVLFLAGILTPIVVKPFGPAIEVTYYTAFGLGSFFLLASYLQKKMRMSK